MSDATRLFFACDVHGSEVCFLKLLSAHKAYKANALILGGDITGKVIVPVVEQPNGTFKTSFMGKEEVLQKRELEALEKSIRNAGYYSFYTDWRNEEQVSADKEEMDDLFSKLMIERLRRWVQIAEERLSGTGVRLFIMPGNDDFFAVDSALGDSEYVVNPEGKVTYIDDVHEMISTGYSNMTPWKAPRDIAEEELARRIDAMASQVRDMKGCIFQFHVPPYDSGLDRAPKLDTSVYPFKQVVIGGQLMTTPVGSTAVRNAIERYQPLLGLHGHVHESRGRYRIGRTLCLNPGSEYLEGIIRGALVTLDKSGVRGHLLISA